MDDASLVRGVECVRDLPADRQRLAKGERAGCDPLGQRRSVYQFQHQSPRTLFACQSVNCRDVGMIEGREHPRFVFEARHPVGV